MHALTKGILLGCCLGVLLAWNVAEIYMRKHNLNMFRNVIQQELKRVSVPSITIKSATVFITEKDVVVREEGG
uniref:Uncharacterized protein n=1 Tax=viral metagenome TaxID=1070528 RepID=A0A6M3KDC7_9ZZZZ